MDKKRDFGDTQEIEDGSLPVSFQKKSESEDVEVTPESYYHNITESSGGDDRYYEIFEKSKHKTLGWSASSMVFGIISVLLCFFGWVGLIFGAVAIILSAVSRILLGYFDGMAIAGLILGIFGVVFGGVIIVAKILVDSGKLKIFFVK